MQYQHKVVQKSEREGKWYVILKDLENHLFLFLYNHNKIQGNQLRSHMIDKRRPQTIKKSSFQFATSYIGDPATMTEGVRVKIRPEPNFSDQWGKSHTVPKLEHSILLVKHGCGNTMLRGPGEWSVLMGRLIYGAKYRADLQENQLVAAKDLTK